jgi:hypothetical protein
MDMDYDILIVGAGLAGLHSALRLSKTFPKKTICIAEAYNYNGGRVVSYSPKGFKGVRWENGAGRIHNSHKMVLEYVKEYGLHTIPLTDTSQWIDGKTKEVIHDRWPSYSSLLVTIFSKMKPSILATHTLYELLTSIYSPGIAKGILSFYPYRAEVFHMRADVALQSLQDEMGSMKGFCVVQEGLSTLINHMVDTLKQRGVIFLYNHRCVSVKENSCTFSIKEKDQISAQETIYAKDIILALHSDALKKISPFSKLPLLQKITMEPLLRCYAIFPTYKGKSWFSEIPKTVTDSPLRFIIPINPAKGVIMISYTDSDDTKPWMKILDSKGSDALEKAIMVETRKLFPHMKIPEPVFFKAHPWYEGCSYWKPGLYNPKELSEKSMNPIQRFEHVFVCGESYSMKQCWMEGALEHAEQMLQKYFL